MIEVLMILADDQIDPGNMANIVTKANAHFNKFATWGNVRILGPNDPNLIQAPVGPSTKANVLAELQSMTGSDRIIYIDDHSNTINGAWNLKNGGPVYIVTHEEVDEALGGNRAYSKSNLGLLANSLWRQL